jgi:hypothetical protein
MNNVARLKPPPRRSVIVTIEDYGKTFTMSASGGNGWEDSASLKKYLEQAFSGWCLAQQEARWEKRKVELNAERAALPWWRRIFEVKFK